MNAALNEQQRRLFVAAEALVRGRGGISEVARATGGSRSKIKSGLNEIEALQTAALADHQPVISVDTKKKELVGA